MESDEQNHTGPRIRSRFEIAGDGLIPEECTHALGLDPTRVVRKGSPRANGRGVYPRTFWAIESVETTSYSTDESMVRLLDRIWSIRERIVSFLADSGLEASFYSGVTITGDRPVYSLSPETVSRMALFGAGYSLDICDLSPE
jgi:Domain of unknown function (DUF4279)